MERKKSVHFQQMLGTVHFCVRILKIRTTFRFRWVGGLQETGCSDFRRKNKYVHLKTCLLTKYFSCLVCIKYLSTILWSNRPNRSISWLVTVYILKWFSGVRIILLFVVRIWGWVGGSSEIWTLFRFLKYVRKNGRSLTCEWCTVLCESLES